jgi:hypothetical protein
MRNHLLLAYITSIRAISKYVINRNLTNDGPSTELILCKSNFFEKIMHRAVINYEMTVSRKFILSIKRKLGIILITNRYISITNIIKTDINSNYLVQ